MVIKMEVYLIALLKYFNILSAKICNFNVVNLKIISSSAKKNESLPPLYFYHQLAYLSAKAKHSSLCICHNLLLKWRHNTSNYKECFLKYFSKIVKEFLLK